MAAALTLVTLVASALRRAGPTPEQIPEDQFVFFAAAFRRPAVLAALGGRMLSPRRGNETNQNL